MDKDLKKPEIEIRAFSNQEIGPCAKLYSDIFGRPPWNENWSLKKAEALVNRMMNKKRFIGYAAEYNSTSVGYLLGYQLNPAFHLNQIYYINELFVDAEHQNMKIGMRLVNTLIHELKHKRIPWVVLLTKKDTNAEKFYKRMGFKRILPGLDFGKRIIMCYRLDQDGMEE